MALVMQGQDHWLQADNLLNLIGESEPPVVQCDDEDAVKYIAGFYMIEVDRSVKV